MSITATQRTELIKVTVGLFNAAPGAVYLNAFVPFAGNTKGLVEALVSDPAFTAIYPAYSTEAEFIGKFIDTLIGTATVGGSATTVADAKAWYAARLNAGETRAAIASEILTDLDATADNHAVWGAVAKQFDNKAAVAEYYSVVQGGSATGVTSLQAVVNGVTATTDVSTPAALEAVIAGNNVDGNVGLTLTLTDGIDNIVANAASNTITADVVQNQNGELVNSLETGDAINGGAGADTLNVVLTNSQSADVDANAPAISATLTGVEIVNVRSQYINTDGVNSSDIDAELHSGVQQYWSTNSRGDVQIEDVRQLPETLTFGMRQTDPVNTAAGVGASDFSVYFDPAQLAADRGTAGDSSLTLTLLDNSAGANELANFPVNGVVFKLGGTQYTVQSTAALGATYAQFVTNLTAELQKVEALKDITVTLNANKTITLTDPAGATFEAVGYTWVGNIVPSGGELQWNQAVGAAVVSEAPITTEVVLDAVGRTSQGGALDIGSMADGGVEVFNVSVDRDSWLTALESRENFGAGDRHLETVNLTSIGANGDLAIGDAVVGVTGELDGRVVDGLTDVREVLNVAFTGELSYGVTLTDDAIGRYLDVASGEVLFTYEGGAGNDNITIADTSAGAALSDDADFAMDVTLGAGNDRLNLNMANVDNVSIDGGTGANVIAVARSHGTTTANTFEGFAGFQTYEVEGTSRFAQDATTHDFTSMAGVTSVVIATDGDADSDAAGPDVDLGSDSTELRDLAAAAAVVITGKNQTLAGANASNADQEFNVIAINGADTTATDSTLRVTLQNTARLDGTLTVGQLTIGDIAATATTAADVNAIRTLELVSAGQRNTENVVDDISAALVNTFNLSGTQDLTATLTAAANSTAIAANRANLVVNGAALTGDLDLTLAGALVTAVDAGTTSTVSLTGTAGASDILRLTGAINTTNDTTVAGFETVQFTNVASGSFDASNVSGVTLFDINDMFFLGGSTLSLVDMQANARINVNIDGDGDVAGNALVFDAASQASTNTLDLEFRDADAIAGDNAVGFGANTISSRDYREISLDLGGYATEDEAYSFNLLMQDAEGDDEIDPVALAATADAALSYDAASAYARTVTVVGGGDQGDAGFAGGVDSVDLGNLTNVISNVDVSGYVGRVTLDIVAYEDTVVDRNVTVSLNGYGATLSEGVVDGPDALLTIEDGTIVSYAFTVDAVEDTENVVITGFAAFNGYTDANSDGNLGAGEVDSGTDLTNLSVLDLSALGVNGLADITLTVLDLGNGGTLFDGVRITSNEGLDFQIDLIGVNLDMLSNENFKFAA
ncbi:MAG: hypothetical protein RBS05_12975 [Zoogloea oleivorans]|jgi:hypothetical protein|uniref:beta strand repeat-containing protein n=1 Tax=Zoogloea oleivorans TaxID=1552750 RepID=UPI002A36D98C|nr:hypothetical protein [Zoogloea oleivorans]MDY0036815.1 hypothetical protein [Zoogloea oleivorans]